MIIFINYNTTKFCQITLHVLKELFTKEKWFLFTASECTSYYTAAWPRYNVRDGSQVKADFRVELQSHLSLLGNLQADQFTYIIRTQL